jgi:uncharacterized OB-fold protein
MNVIAQWRERARALRGEYWACEKCGRLAAVRRAACTGCGHAGAELAAVPRRFEALHVSHAHAVVETMDQVTERRGVILAKSESGQLFAFPICEADAAHGKALEGAALDLVLRRKTGALGRRDPIAYQRKLAASAETRRALISKKEG